MKIKDGIYYQVCGDIVYLRNVNKGKDYLFNRIAFDILEFCRRNPGKNAEKLYVYLQEQYEAVSPEQIQKDVQEFIALLEGEEILASMTEQPHKREEINIRAAAEEECMKRHQLFSASLELTYRCSERCVHCYIDDGICQDARRELSLEEYKRILRELRELGCLKLLLTGGEVCLRKDFISIADYAVSLGMLVDIYTNGISMSGEQFDALCAMKVNSVSFSLYSGDAAVHDAVTQVPGSFEKTLRTMMMFQCARVDTFIKSVVIRQNIDSLESLYQLGKRLRIPVLPSVMVIDSHTGRTAETFRLGAYDLYYKAMKLKCQYEQLPKDTGQRNPDESICTGGSISLSVDPYGGIHPCLAFTEPIGNIRESTIKEVWENSEFLKKLRKFHFRDLDKKCAGCSYINYCTVCIGDSYSEHCGEIKPCRDTCIIARAVHDAILDQGGEDYAEKV